MPLDITGSTTSGGAITSFTRGVKSAASAAAGVPGGGGTFAESLGKLVENVETSAADANQAVASMVDSNGDVHEAMIALQRAEMTLELTVQVRNKLVQAYNDIMRMPI
jgi:flagellar hook-basal body complex protein FliE